MVDSFTFAAMNAMTANHAERVAGLSAKIDRLLDENSELRASLIRTRTENLALSADLDQGDMVRASLLADAKQLIEQSYKDGHADGKRDGLEILKPIVQEQLDKLNDTIRNLKDELAREQAKVRELESREARSDMLLTYADSVIAGQYAVVVKFEQCHPESTLLQPSDMIGADGRPVSFSDSIYHQAFAEKFWRSGGTPEIRKQLGVLGMDLSSLDLASAADESAPPAPAP